MKSKEVIKAERERILKKLQEDENPINYIYGLAQAVALKWVLEEEKQLEEKK